MASHLEFPPSKHTVRVRMVDTTALMTIASQSFIDPVQPGHELINVTDVAFLIEHEASGKKVMFDLGTRKDYWNLPPVIQKRLGDVIPSLRVDKDVSDILQENGILLDTICNPALSLLSPITNPSSINNLVSLPLGPHRQPLPLPLLHIHHHRPRPHHLRPAHLPRLSRPPPLPLSASDFKSRAVHEIHTFHLHIGSLPAHDYFSDGSFYLLDTPGHCTGHICGLARTSTNPDTFIFMGGDICHFAGDFRPSPSIPLPDPLPAGVLDNPHSPRALHQPLPRPCPAEIFTSHHPRHPAPDSSRTTPWYEITSHPRAAYTSPATARSTLAKMQPFDDSPHVLVCIAHDPTLLDVLPTLNQYPESDLNGWFQKGWKERCHWGWLNELPREGRPGRGKVVEGFWREGESWDFELFKREASAREEGRL